MTDTAPHPVATRPQQTVAVRQPQRGDFSPMAIPEAVKFAELVQNAEGMIPKAYLRNPGKILACVLAGQELGVGPMAALRAFHVVEGKPCADYSFWIARLKAAGYRVEWLERTQEKVSLRLTAPDGSHHVETWDKARAVTAGLWNGKDPWKKYPQTMLSARCVTSAGRVFAGEIMFGCYENDEADEIMRDAVVETIRTHTVEGPAAARAAAASGSGITDEAIATEARAKECADMAKALGLSRQDVFDMFKELGIEHTEKTRMSELPREALDRLAERLDAEAKLRSGDDKPADGGGEAKT